MPSDPDDHVGGSEDATARKSRSGKTPGDRFGGAEEVNSKARDGDEGVKESAKTNGGKDPGDRVGGAKEVSARKARTTEKDPDDDADEAEEVKAREAKSGGRSKARSSRKKVLDLSLDVDVDTPVKKQKVGNDEVILDEEGTEGKVIWLCIE